MIDYSKCIIYKLIHKDDYENENIYIGHTTSWGNRKRDHKKRTLNPKNGAYNFKMYKFIRDNGSWEMWDMIEIEKYPCNDKREAESRERYWIETLHPTLNKQIPTRTRAEWYQENKEHKNTKSREWGNNNPDKRKEIARNYYEKNKEHINAQRREWRKNNPDKSKEQSRKYYEKTKLNN